MGGKGCLQDWRLADINLSLELAKRVPSSGEYELGVDPMLAALIRPIWTLASSLRAKVTSTKQKGGCDDES